MSDDEFPELATLILRPSTKSARTLNVPSSAPAPRRSPRKQAASSLLADAPSLAASSQQRISPRKQSSPKRAPVKRPQAKAPKAVLEDVPDFRRAVQRSNAPVVSLIEDESDDGLANLLQPLSKLSLQKSAEYESTSDKENARRDARSKKTQPTSTMSRITQAARKVPATAKANKHAPKRSNPYVSREAHCEDLNESSGTEGEGEETDLSGFVVDDDACLSFHGTAEEISSDSEDERAARRRQRKQKPAPSPRKRLVRGRRKQLSDSEEDADEDTGLAQALDGMNLGGPALERQKNANRRKTLEVIDLTESSPVQRPETPNQDEESEPEQEQEEPRQLLADPFSSFNTALQLQPPTKSQPQLLLPSKMDALPASPKRPAKTTKQIERPKTPPGTPPQSPTKLKSPSKLLSPSKRNTEAARSPHRQSMDAFWDHNVVNEWHDTFSPKKAPTFSPRKNPLARFNLYADDDLSEQENSQPTTTSSQDPFDTSSDSLPSPCDSPTKSRSPSKLSALKTEQSRLREEKKAKLAAKKAFDSEKETMATTLLLTLDKHITSSKISTMSASTGGIKVIWSKTLRSTAGRANWKRTVTKASGSPVKGNPDSLAVDRQPGVVVSHFASIELAEKIIDRPERLVNTLAHEFCHLANFMVSNVRDQPHGTSFKRWGQKVTSFLSSSVARKESGYRPEWKACEVSTKHSYVVETKYLWVCAGRPAGTQRQTLTQRMLNIEVEREDEEGCGAEYGRHSRSIDIEKQRCGRCKGFLVQVRPAPRGVGASPRKSPVKRGLRSIREESHESGSGVEGLEKLMEVVELSD
ncbi:hypothetical protein PMZ80_010222 [Knufia obscura]|uniref:SprT-like domain-containing protein n=2 Tax=Knufia TaxID=430999 RepID=A0AAN8F7R1_9EURO|nr:hypothetical protein PMZ80_010222 [Knufia obscura]KAK5952961.1 hypothetical protein OHC33_006082 [Knufia fluminis]